MGMCGAPHSALLPFRRFGATPPPPCPRAPGLNEWDRNAALAGARTLPKIPQAAPPPLPDPVPTAPPAWDTAAWEDASSDDAALQG